ncbi:BolA domain-containing protein [Thecamonas trahens ATCC 50062]|uniref:BolA domain-containing protein n=1 Tax=Thecamonas trahens ATCC 50062 TaxID=461836 RepID=A0A0L0D9F7_THETB|nr:BolA domain-containing protein [Thecamonas trahens ATCC 50062]KNC48875.1 BolA domain-containing protein [Thecamonas trahens ATCC 50062]|eukprot:XP_013758295.1 BolA domain-containing protein [Thecamonas trahens ATCC 50062]
MSVGTDELKAKIQAAFSPVFLDVQDVSGGCGQSFDVIVVSEAFEGVALLDRHRMVNDAVADEIKAIHAFSLKTWTPAQYEKKKDKL